VKQTGIFSVSQFRTILHISLHPTASFHIIRLFCDEYVKYLVDCKLDEKRRQSDSTQWQSPVNPAMTTVQLGFDGAGLFNPPFPDHHGQLPAQFSGTEQFLDQQLQHQPPSLSMLHRSESSTSVKSMSIENVITHDEQPTRPRAQSNMNHSGRPAI
jgi:hypothetical protein